MSGLSRSLSRGVYRGLGKVRGGGIPRLNLLFYAKDGVTDTIGLSISRYSAASALGELVYWVKPSTNFATKVMFKLNATGWDDASGWTDNTTINSVLTTAGVNGCLYLKNGTYSPSMAGGNIIAKANNQLILGESRGAIIDFTGYADNMTSCSTYTNYRLHRLSLKNAAINRSALTGSAGGTMFVNDCFLSGNFRHINLSGATITIGGGSVLEGALDTTQGIAYITSGTLNMLFSTVIDNAGTIRNSGGTANIISNVFAGQLRQCVRSDNAAAVSLIANNNFVSCGTFGLTFHVIEQTAGTVTDYNNNILPAFYNPDTYFTTGTIGGSGDISVAPKFVKTKRAGLFSVMVDDHNNFDYFTDVADVAEPFGIFVTLALNSPQDMSPAQWDELAAYIQRGHDVSCHTKNHVDLTNTDAINFATTATNPHLTISVDSSSASSADWAGTLTVGDDGGADTVIALTGTTTVGDVVTAVQARTGWATTDVSASIHTNLVLACCLADVTNETSCPYVAQYNQENYWYTEIAEIKKLIETQLSALMGAYVVETFTPPGNATNSTLQVWLQDDANFASAGTSAFLIGRGSDDRTVGSYDLSSISVYNILALRADNLFKTNLTRNVPAACQWAAHNGVVLSFYAHDTAEMTIGNWAVLLEAIVNDGSCQVHTFTELAGVLRSTPWLTADDLVYTRSWDDDYDYGLQAGSLCIGAGTATALTGTANLYEAAEIKIYDGTYQIPDGPFIDGVDIGAYAYSPSNRVYPKLSNPSEGVWIWESAPDLLDVVGVNNAVYNLDGTGKSFATQALAFAAFASLADDTYVFAGDTQIAVYTIDQSANATKINQRIR